MNARALTVFFWGCLVAAAAVAGEEHQTRIEIAIDDDGDEPRVFKWHSSDADSDLSKLEVGKSKTLTGEDGEDVVVTRTKNGLEFNIDGEVIFLDGSELHGDAQTRNRHEKKIIIKRKTEETTD